MEHKSIWSCDVDPTQTISAGTEVKLPHVWAHTAKSLTSTKDIEIKLDQDMPLHRALALVENAAREFVESEGASDIRQYFIEGVMIDKKGVEFILGT